MPPTHSIAVNADPDQPTEPFDTHVVLHQQIDRLNAAAWLVAENDPGQAQQQVEQIHTLLAQAAEVGSPYLRGQATVQVVQSAILRSAGSYEPAIQHSIAALALYQQLDETGVWVFRVYYNLGLTYARLGDYALAEEANLNLLEMAQEQDDLNMQATALRNIGVMHSRLNEPREALRYYVRCEALYTQINELAGLASIYNNCCYEHYKLGEYTIALEFGLKSLPLFSQVHSLSGQSRIHGNLGLVYTALGQFDAADRHLQQALHFGEQSQSTFSQLLSLQYIGLLRQKQGHSKAALAATHAALNLAEQTRDRWEQADCCRQLAEIYETMGSLEQMAAFYKRYISIRDTLFNEDTLVRLRGVETLWRTRRAQHEIETQRRLREQERQQTERLIRMRDEFLDAATHDLKNPLAIISMSVHKLRRYVPTDNTPAHEVFERIDSVVVQMRDLIANLLDISPLETGYVLQPAPADLIALVRDEVAHFRELAEHKNIRLTLDSGLPRLTLRIDSARMRQVLGNLLSNAMKYTPDNGSVTVSIMQNTTQVMLIVSDTGIGIPAAALPHIFERFYRVRSPEHEAIDGTGLGLAITRSIIEQHSGAITVTSTPGVGTTFIITLPLMAHMDL